MRLLHEEKDLFRDVLFSAADSPSPGLFFYL